MPTLGPSHFFEAMNDPGAGAEGGRFLPLAAAAPPLAADAGLIVLPPSLRGVPVRGFAFAGVGDADVFAGLAPRLPPAFFTGVPAETALAGMLRSSLRARLNLRYGRLKIQLDACDRGTKCTL